MIIQADTPVRRHVDLAQSFSEWVRDDARFELAAPVPFNLVCFRHTAGDAVNERLLGELNASGELFLTHTRVDDRLVLRMSIGQAATEARHVAAGVLIVFMGLSMAGWIPSGLIFRNGPPVGQLINRTFKRFVHPESRSAVYFPLGMVLGLLPCGPVYTAMIAAAARIWLCS